MIMMPHTRLMFVNTFGVSLDLKRLTRSTKLENHVIEASDTPVINNMPCVCESVALNPLSNIVPSIIACGFNQVTVKHMPMVANIEVLTFESAKPVLLLLKSMMPILITPMLPTTITALLRNSKRSRSKPTPKKQASAKLISKNIVITATCNALIVLSFVAELITYAFCIPIGAT